MCSAVQCDVEGTSACCVLCGDLLPWLCADGSEQALAVLPSAAGRLLAYTPAPARGVKRLLVLRNLDTKLPAIYVSKTVSARLLHSLRQHYTDMCTLHVVPRQDSCCR